MLRGFVHPLHILVRVIVALERDGGSDAHGHILGGDHPHVLGRQFRGLVRREDHVSVVRQNEHAFCVHLADGAQEVVHGGIHGLSALDDLVHVQVLEELGESVAQGNRHKAVTFGGFLLSGLRCARSGFRL